MASQWAVRAVFERRSASRRKASPEGTAPPRATGTDGEGKSGKPRSTDLGGSFPTRSAAPERPADAETHGRLDGEVTEVARQAATEEAMSLDAWLSRAVRKQARLESGLRAVARFEADYGPMPAEKGSLAQEILERFGVHRAG